MDAKLTLPALSGVPGCWTCLLLMFLRFSRGSRRRMIGGWSYGWGGCCTLCVVMVLRLARAPHVIHLAMNGGIGSR